MSLFKSPRLASKTIVTIRSSKQGDAGRRKERQMIENLMWLIAGVALGFIFEEIRYAPEDPEEDER